MLLELGLCLSSAYYRWHHYPKLSQFYDAYRSRQAFLRLLKMIGQAVTSVMLSSSLNSQLML